MYVPATEKNILLCHKSSPANIYLRSFTGSKWWNSCNILQNTHIALAFISCNTKFLVTHRHLHQHSLYCVYCRKSQATVVVLGAIAVPNLWVSRSDSSAVTRPTNTDWSLGNSQRYFGKSSDETRCGITFSRDSNWNINCPTYCCFYKRHNSDVHWLLGKAKKGKVGCIKKGNVCSYQPKKPLPSQIRSITELWRAIPKQPFHWLISHSKLQWWIFQTRQIWIKTSWLFSLLYSTLE